MAASSGLPELNREHAHLLWMVFAVMDGGRMKCATYTEPDKQNAYWEGFTQADEVSNLFL